MGTMDDKATSKWVADKNEEALKQAARDTIFLTQSWKGNRWFRSSDIKALILNGIAAIGNSVRNHRMSALDPGLTSSAFLHAAEAIELFLWNQLQLKNGKKGTAANDKYKESVEDITNKFESTLKLSNNTRI
jgi:hypothetical protein